MSLLGSIVGGVASGFFGNKSSKRAASAQDAANRESARQFDIVREDTAPYREAGQDALSRVLGLLTDPNADYSQVMQMPGFEFQRQQGEESLGNVLRANRIGPGRFGKEMIRYGQDYAGTKFDDYLSRLLGIANYGVGGIAQSAGAGARHSGNVSSNANSLSNIYMNQGQAANQAVQGTIQNYLLSKYMKNRRYPDGGYGGGYGITAGSMAA